MPSPTRLSLISWVLGATLMASHASADFLGSWTLYHNPGFLWGSNTMPVTAIRVRVAFGSLASFTDGLDLFETSAFTQGDDGLVLVADSASDPDFDQIATQLTNGAINDKVFVETRLIGLAASAASQNELFWANRPGSSAPADFSGYTLDRIEMAVELVSWVSPGRDSNNDGVWTDYEIDTRLDFYGTPIPEPALAAMLAPLFVGLVVGRNYIRRNGRA